jgi:hypothetical protein
MAAVLHIVEVEIASIRRDYSLVRVHVQNVGNRTVASGALVARQTSDGTVRPVEFFLSEALAPSDQIRLSQLVRGSIHTIEFRNYRETEGDVIPVTGLIKRTILSALIGFGRAGHGWREPDPPGLRR